MALPANTSSSSRIGTTKKQLLKAQDAGLRAPGFNITLPRTRTCYRNFEHVGFLQLVM